MIHTGLVVSDADADHSLQAGSRNTKQPAVECLRYLMTRNSKLKNLQKGYHCMWRLKWLTGMADRYVI